MILLECIHKRMPTISQAERLKEEARRQKDVVMMFASDESVIRLIEPLEQQVVYWPVPHPTAPVNSQSTYCSSDAPLGYTVLGNLSCASCDVYLGARIGRSASRRTAQRLTGNYLGDTALRCSLLPRPRS